MNDTSPGNRSINMLTQWSKIVSAGLQPRCLYNRVFLSKDRGDRTECRKVTISVLSRGAVLVESRARTCKTRILSNTSESRCDTIDFLKEYDIKEG